jgi:hypothetical protein
MADPFPYISDPIIGHVAQLEALLSSGRTYIDDSQYPYPRVEYNWSPDIAKQIQIVLQGIITSDAETLDEDVSLDGIINDWVDRIEIPTASRVNKGVMYRWLTSDDGKCKIHEALLEVLPNIMLSKLGKTMKQVINMVLNMKSGGDVSHIINVKCNQYLMNLLSETVKGTQAKLEISSCLIMGDPHGMRDIDVAVVITPEVAANFPSLQHAKMNVDMKYLTDLLLEHAGKHGVHKLPPIGATVIVVDKIDAKDVIVATSGGGSIATNNIIASTQRYFHQPSSPLKIDMINPDIILSMSYMLLWMTQKMKFLTPHLYNRHLRDDINMPTYREAIQSIYHNPMGRVYFSRSYIMPALKDNVEPSDGQWGIFKSLVWKLSQNILIPRGYYPYTRWDVRNYLNLLYGPQFSEYCSKFGMSNVDLGDGAIWYMCEGKTRSISALSNDDALANMPAELTVEFNRYVIPFMLDIFNAIIDANIDAILVHTSLKAIPSIVNTFASQYPCARDMVNNVRLNLDTIIDRLDTPRIRGLMGFKGLKTLSYHLD